MGAASKRGKTKRRRTELPCSNVERRLAGFSGSSLFVTTGITEGQLRDAPEFSDDSWEDRDWEARTHEHYGVPGSGGTGA